MLSPSTAPRWKRQTKTGRERSVEVGRGRPRPSAARARKSGSRPRLRSEIPPDFTNTRLEIDMCPPSNLYRLLPLLPTSSLPLKLRPAERESDREHPRLSRIRDICKLSCDDPFRILGHGAAQDLAVHDGDVVVGPRRSAQPRVRGDGHAGKLAGG